MLRVKRQHALEHQQGKQGQAAEGVKQQDRQQILQPAHLLGADPGHAPQDALDAGQAGKRDIVHHPRQTRPQRARQHQQHQQIAG